MIINLRSVHFRLTAWYSLGLFISTALIFTAFYFITRQTLLDQTDSTITSHAGGIIQIVNSSTLSNPAGLFNQEVISQQFSEMPGMLIIIMDATGKIIASSQTESGNNPVVTDLLEKSSSIIRPTFIERKVGTTILRIGVFPVLKNGAPSNLVLVAHPVDVIYQSLASLSFVLFGIYLLLLIPIIFGGYFLSQRALKPITELSTQLEKITSQNLDEPVKQLRSGDEVEKLVTSFNELLQRLHQAFERERQFISDVTHELKTPLSTLRSSIEVGLTKTRSEIDYKKILNENLVDVENISGTLNNVLDLAWSEAEQNKELTDSFNLSKLAEEVSELCAKLAKKKQIKVDSKIQPEIFIAGREDKVFRAVLNIIDNAVKYTPSKGQISVLLVKENDKAALSISDNGVGIESEELPKIFNRFYRGSKTVKTFGSGLGLSIAEGIIRAHRGEIKVLSQVGKGTSFIITFPIVSH